MGTVKRFENSTQLFEEAAKFIQGMTDKCCDSFSIALAGGSTPKGLYERMSSPEMRKKVPWEKMHFFWGDERWVPLADKRSNYKMAKESLLDPAAVPAKNIHPVNTSLPSVEAGAAAYEKTIRTYFQTGGIPKFDLVLLGLGEDGHTASLFPGDPALKENTRLAAPARLKTEEPRVTLTYPLINQAECVLFLASGENKKKIVEEIFSNRPGVSYPAMKIRPVSGRLLWFLSI